MKKNIKIGDFNISKESPTFVIGELSCNHQNDYNIAIKTIDAMIDSGVDCVKIQTSRPDKITIDCDKEDFVVKGGTLWDNMTLYQLYQKTYTPWEWQKPIRDYVKSKGKAFISSPFDLQAVDFLNEIEVDAFKIASFEITDIPLIEKAASYGKPVIISTGIAHKEDIELALETCRNVGNESVILLKCTSEYPTPWDEVNLRMVSQFSEDYDCLVGISDHTLGDIVATSSVVLGSKVIEKHFILDRKMGGPDSQFSMEPNEFRMLVDRVHNVEKILGSNKYELSPKNESSRRFMRSLYVVSNMKKGDVITESNIASIRPGFGLHPKYLKNVLGKKVNCDIDKGTRFSLDFIQE